MRIFPIPFFSPSFFMALNFSTIGFTLPGLQNMRSRTSSMGSSSSVVGFRALSTDVGPARS